MIASIFCRRVSKALACIVLIVAVQALGGCTSINVASEPSKARAGEHDGYIVLAITGNTGQVGQIQSIQLKLANLRQDQRDSIQILHNVAVGLARDTALFVGIVPEGDYSLNQLDFGTKYLLIPEGARNLMGNVHVNAGAVADLGRIVMTPLNTWVLTGRSVLETSNKDLVKRFSTENASIYDHEVSGGWVSPHSPKDLVEEYAMSRPVGADTPTELPTGEVIAASRLGTLLIRNAKGRWRAVRTGNLNSFLAVQAVREDVDGVAALAVAVGEFNTLAVLDKDEKLNLRHTGDLPLGNIIYVTGNSHVGWFVAHKAGDRVGIYKSKKLDNGQWSLLKQEKVGFSFWNGSNDFWIWSNANGFSYAVSEGVIRSYDYATSEWSESRAPNNNRLVSIAPSDAGIGILTSPGGGFAGVFAGMYVSYDGGKVWVEVKSPYKVKLYAPRVLADGTLLVAGGGPFAKRELQKSSDQGKTWQVCSDRVDISDNIVPLPNHGLLAIDSGAQFGLAHVMHSSDSGKTWVTEYSNFDMQAYEAEKQKKQK